MNFTNIVEQRKTDTKEYAVYDKRGKMNLLEVRISGNQLLRDRK